MGGKDDSGQVFSAPKKFLANNEEMMNILYILEIVYPSHGFFKAL